MPTERIISEDDLKKLIRVIQPNQRWKIMIPILLLTGLRIGELIGLYWSDIDFENSIININRAVSMGYAEKDGVIIKLGSVISKTKSEDSVRELPVSTYVMKYFNEWKEKMKNNSEWLRKIKQKGNEKLVFPNYYGNMINYSTLYTELKEFLETHNLEHCGIVFHKLRHCYATHLVDCGIDINVVSKLLGHKNITTTANTYVKSIYSLR